MIRKLRVKLVCILMALLTVMLGVTFGLVLHFTQQSLEAESLRTLEARSRMVWIAGSLVFLAARAYISVATAKKHNTNINRKLGVTSREELMLYIDLFRRCGRLDEIAAPRAEDTARCTT